MPTYEFKCIECTDITDKFYHCNNLPSKIQCPICGGIAHRLPFPRPGHIHINRGIQGRVWHCWDERFGDPPKDLVDELKKEDRPTNKETGDFVVRPDKLIEKGLNKG